MTADESPRGPFYFDKFGNPVQNIYQESRQTGWTAYEHRGETYKDVSQFGPLCRHAGEIHGGSATTRDYPPGDKASYFKEIESTSGRSTWTNWKRSKAGRLICASAHRLKPVALGVEGPGFEGSSEKTSAPYHPPALTLTLDP